MAILKAKDLDYNLWKSMLDKLVVPDETRMIIDTIEELRFEWFNVGRIPYENCTRGRIFHPDGELKWRRIDDIYRTVFLGDKDWAGDMLADASDELEPKGLIAKDSSMVLWGERTDMEDEWLEQIVPHRFHYPFSNGTIPRGRLKLITENWYDSSGQLVFVRFKDLKEMEEMEGSYATR